MKSLCDGVLGSVVLGAFFLQLPAARIDEAQARTIYSFCSHARCTDGALPFASLIDVNGILYGTTETGGSRPYNGGGTVFSLDPGTGAQSILYAFVGGRKAGNPEAGLIHMNGNFYGTTGDGGGGACAGAGCGTIFALEKKR